MDNDLVSMRRFYEILAELEGNMLNPDEVHVQRILKGLQARGVKYGYRYCPCRLPTGNHAKDAGLVCPCIYHRDEIAKDGHCYCKLFVRLAEQLKEASINPEVVTEHEPEWDKENTFPYGEVLGVCV